MLRRQQTHNLDCFGRDRNRGVARHGAVGEQHEAAVPLGRPDQSIEGPRTDAAINHIVRTRLSDRADKRHRQKREGTHTHGEESF